MQGDPLLHKMQSISEDPAGDVGQHKDAEKGTAIYALHSRSRRKRRNDVKEVLFIWLRELFGTAVFTLVACVSHGNQFSVGITYAILQASSELSSSGGLHLNSVISLAVAISGQIRKPVIILPMIWAQFLGCLLGAGLHRGSLRKLHFIGGRYYSDAPDCYRISLLQENVDLVKYCLGELLYTSILVTVFLRLFPLKKRSLPANKTDALQVENRKLIHALFVGLALVALTGGSYPTKFIGVMNPFQAFGPMAVWVATVKSELENSLEMYPGVQDLSNLWRGHWVYWVGPIMGGVLAGIVDRLKDFCDTSEKREVNEESEVIISNRMVILKKYHFVSLAGWEQLGDINWLMLPINNHKDETIFVGKFKSVFFD